MNDYLNAAIEAAEISGKLLRENFGRPLTVNAAEAHDIKLELDVQSQALISDHLLARFPDHAIYGEEGVIGNQDGEFQWIVDPIDGTVNYFYGIPHFCISIALRRAGEIIVGVIYDPIRGELWSASQNRVPQLNGSPCKVSERSRISDSMVSIGFSKTRTTIDSGLPVFEKMVYKVRKCRSMGSAALDMAYVACGRLDAYIEQSVSLWDIAAGILLVKAAGGRVELYRHPEAPDKYSVKASSGRIDLSV